MLIGREKEIRIIKNCFESDKSDHYIEMLRITLVSLRRLRRKGLE